MTTTALEIPFTCFGTYIPIPAELAGHEKPTDLAAYMKVIRPLLEQVKACHPTLDPNLAQMKDIYVAFEKYMLGNNLRGRLYKNRYPRWETEYNALEDGDYIDWLLRRWTNWLGQDERLGLFGL